MTGRRFRHETLTTRHVLIFAHVGDRAPVERRALDREVIRHAPARLDRMIANQLPEARIVRIAALEAPNGDPSTARALKERGGRPAASDGAAPRHPQKPDA
jgi:hypothetical protein